MPGNRHVPFLGEGAAATLLPLPDWLVAHLNPANNIPSVAHEEWEGADLRLRAAVEVLKQRANEGQVVPRSVGIPRARARLPQSLDPNQLELVYRRGRLEALG